MHDTVLNETAQRNIQILSGTPFVKSFYLAGGTGCALHLGHRISFDLDFFIEAEFSPLDIQRLLRKKGDFITDYSDKRTLTGRFNTSKISLFQYDYSIIKRHHVILSAISSLLCTTLWWKLSNTHQYGFERIHKFEKGIS